ncbi:MAG: DUF1385 domain-containing protein [Oscillospiraceae bacterium]|nr:DUF1385 domain-containing protein [Oscillospiraceae bacterium]
MPEKNFKTSIGGQALIEGVMMRGPKMSAMATRLPGGGVDVEEWDTPAASGKWYRKTPFVRGCFNLVDSMRVGYRCLMKSAEKAGFEDEEPTRFEKWLTAKLGDNLSKVFAGFSMVLGVILAVGLFMILPLFLAGLVASLADFALTPGTRSLLEGLIRIIIFILYILVCTRMKEIRRVFEYHGAEHKTIACHEAGEALTVENIRPKSRFHPRCGTSFLLIVLVISILIFSVIQWESVLLRAAFRLALLPVVVSISYEIIKLAGRYDNILTRLISLPGLWLQRLTSYEPDDGQIEIAIAAMTPAIPAEGGADKW